MPDDTLNDQEVTDLAAEEALEESQRQEQAPAFDPEAERARIREEESARLQTEFEARYKPAEKAEESKVPDRYEDPEGYDAYRDEQLTQRILSQVAPLLQVVNTNTVDQRFRAAGVGDAGLAYVRQMMPNINATLDDKTFGIIADAARYQEVKSAKSSMNPERPYGERGSSDITDAERKQYGIGTQYGPTEAEVRAWKKEEAELSKR